MIVTLTPTAATLFSAKQVRNVGAGGQIQFTDGSSELFLVTPAGQTFVPTSTGNQVPNPGDWILNSRQAFDSVTTDGYKGANFGSIVAPNPNGPFLVVPNTTFQTTYSVNYGESTAPNQGIVQ
jgi:hypothetical protein